MPVDAKTIERLKWEAERGLVVADSVTLLALIADLAKARHDLHVAAIDLKDSQERVERRNDDIRALNEYAAELRAKAALLDAPEIHDFVKAVVIEAAHQRARWPSEHDAGKTDADWFWLIGYLAGKALHNPGGEHDKQLHRIVTVAAAACNWHAAKLGKTDMRPGIDAPPGEAA